MPRLESIWPEAAVLNNAFEFTSDRPGGHLFFHFNPSSGYKNADFRTPSCILFSVLAVMITVESRNYFAYHPSLDA